MGILAFDENNECRFYPAIFLAQICDTLRVYAINNALLFGLPLVPHVSKDHKGVSRTCSTYMDC